jgi:hypothetical protein
MSWQEKKRLESRDEARAAKREQREQQRLIPKDERGRILRGVNVKDFRPKAPRNTSQYIMKEAEKFKTAEFDGEPLDDMGTMADFVPDDPGASMGVAAPPSSSAMLADVAAGGPSPAAVPGAPAGDADPTPLELDEGKAGESAVVIDALRQRLQQQQADSAEEVRRLKRLLQQARSQIGRLEKTIAEQGIK